ncbi:hypothetical protein [Nocardia sp. NBC_01388]|uniref:hypothetical protein n=1 Tax=Nocardia sp. NBC_01388 TaxID=2903596 RepID=UPI00325027E9
MGASCAVGPLVGGIATEFIGWRWVFLMNVPIPLVCGTAVAQLVRSEGSRREGSLDPVGQLLVISTCAALFAAVSVADYGRIGPVVGIGCAAACVIGLLVRRPTAGQVINREYFGSVRIIVVIALPARCARSVSAQVYSHSAAWASKLVRPRRRSRRSSLPPR